MSLQTIVHFLPKNLAPCGGIKVHYQLAEIEAELGYQTFIVFDGPYFPDWMAFVPKNVTIMSLTDWRKLEISPETTLVIGWEDLRTLKQEFPKEHVVGYVQGEALFDRSQPKDIPIWVSSRWNQESMRIDGREGSYVPVFVDENLFKPIRSIEETVQMIQTTPVSLQAFDRKHGQDRFNTLLHNLVPETASKILPRISPTTTEAQFIRLLETAPLVLSTSYPEGFNLIPLEAMACGAFVVGFTGGGGLEFMKNGENCFTVADGDFKGLASRIQLLFSMSSQELSRMLVCSRETAQKYSRENTKQYLIQALEHI